MAPRARWHLRRRDAWLVLGGVAGGFGVTLVVLTAGLHVLTGPAAAPSRPVRVPAGRAGQGGLSPAVLDRQWLAYSDRSGCADRSGGDGVFAVRLGPAQIAWFFADSYLGPAGPRAGFAAFSGFVHNLIVLQTTSRGRSTMVTITGGHACAGPGRAGNAVPVVSAANAGGPRADRFWTADGLRAGSRVLSFYNQYLPGPIPFTPVGTVLASFPVAGLAADGRGPGYGEVIRPHITAVPRYTPPDGGTPIVWGTALLSLRGTVYVYGWQSPDPRQLARLPYLARVPAARLADLAAWRYYAGPGRWSASQALARPLVTTAGLNVDTAFSVTAAAGRYWLIQQAGPPGSPDIEAYPAARPWGPFDGAAGLLLYRAPGIGFGPADNDQIMYGAAAEPALSGRRTLVISYDVSSVAVTAGCVPLFDFTNTILQPRFIAVPLSVFRAAGPGDAEHPALPGTGRVAAGPAGYPDITGPDPGQWYDAWSYPGGCPPVPAVRDLTARPAGRSVRVSWLALGRGVSYRVLVRGPGGGYALVRTVRSAQVALTGLARGRSYRILVVPQNRRHRSGPGAAVTVTVR
jgi:hypothetical protein